MTHGETGHCGVLCQQPELKCSKKEHLRVSTCSTPGVLQPGIGCLDGGWLLQQGECSYSSLSNHPKDRRCGPGPVQSEVQPQIGVFGWPSFPDVPTSQVYPFG